MPTHAQDRSRDDRRPNARTVAASCGVLTLVAAMGGCEIDGWLGDPSAIGRWEHTPTVVPILERIDAIEADTGEFVDIDQVTPDDLVPQVEEYILGPGDFVRITVFGLLQPEVPYVLETAISENGAVDLPDVGRFILAGRTSFDARRALIRLLIDTGRFAENSDPIVDVQALSRQEASYSVFGAISQPGRFAIPRPDHRLLEALTNAGGVSPIIREVFVIRQVPLSDAVTDEPTLPVQNTDTQDRPFRPTTPGTGGSDGATDSIFDLLDEIEQQGAPGSPGAPASLPSNPAIQPGVMHRDPALRPSPSVVRTQDGMSDGDTPAIDLDDSVAPPSIVDGPAPVVDLVEPDGSPVEQGQWRFINGRWVQVMPADPQSFDQLPEGDDPLEGEVTASDLMTQRVIAVPVGPLLQGIARFNIVIRPGDIVHVPAPESGIVYAAGPGIARAGSYNIPANGRLTIMRLVASAGGLSAISVPERV
ncbi:MAG: polysaccharide biosynthesis/export family protein, partial [Planctomycetota bacterium]